VLYIQLLKNLSICKFLRSFIIFIILAILLILFLIKIKFLILNFA